jgi:dihydrofolate reductase
MPKYVVSSTLDSPTWTNTTVLKGDIVDEVSKLRGRHHGLIVVHGSAQLVHTLIDNDLVDELHLVIFPVCPGDGKTGLRRDEQQEAFRLADSKTALASVDGKSHRVLAVILIIVVLAQTVQRDLQLVGHQIRSAA